MSTPDPFAVPGVADLRRPVLVPLDGSREAERALPWGVQQAARRRAPLLLVQAVGYPYAVTEVGTGLLPRRSQEPLAQLRVVRAGRDRVRVPHRLHEEQRRPATGGLLHPPGEGALGLGGAVQRDEHGPAEVVHA